MNFRAMIACSGLLLSACSSTNGGRLGFVMLDKNQHVAAASPLFSKYENQCMSSASFVATIFNTHPNLSEFPRNVKPKCEELSTSLKSALVDGSGNMSKMQRNNFIDALAAVSNKKCGEYISFLQQYHSNVNSIFGIATQTFAGVATLVSGGTAQGFAAAAGLSSGTQSTLNKAHFADQGIGVLARAMANARTTRRAAMVVEEAKAIDQYGVQQGLADVFDYHASCSIVAGLTEAEKAVEQARSPSLETFNTVLTQISAAQQKMAAIAKGKPLNSDAQAVEDASNATEAAANAVNAM